MYTNTHIKTPPSVWHPSRCSERKGGRASKHAERDGRCATGSFCAASTGSVVVAINTSQPNSTVYYTLDGSTPTLASPVYVPPLTLVQTGTIVSSVEVDDSNDGTGTQ